MKGIPLFPVYLMDFWGSIIMLTLSLVALGYAWNLKKRHPRSVLFAYLFWLSLTFVALSVSRSVGHVLKFVLAYQGKSYLWTKVAPLSGGLNTIAFVSVAVLTFYFPTVRQIIALVREDALRYKRAKEDLEIAHSQLRELTRTLEERVEERTRELILSEQKFRRLFEGSKDAIFFCDREGRITDINPSGAEMLGFKNEEEVIGRFLLEFFVHEEDWFKYCQTIFQQGYIKDFETVLKGIDGTERYIIITSEAIYEGGNLVGCEGIAKDITTFKQMTEQLIYSEKMASLGQLAAGVAHEINTPLGVILGYTQLLKEDLQEDPDVCEELSIIEKQAKTCKRIVSDLLSFSRSSKGQMRTKFSLNECVKQTVALVKHIFENEGITLVLELAPDLPEIPGNSDQIAQVILNLLNNAHDAIGRKGRVYLWTFYDEARREVYLRVGDTGKGIPAEIKSKIFDPFFTTKPVGRGTGLGLSVSYGIIRDHGGRINVYSPPGEKELAGMGIRTVFEIVLPVEAKPVEAKNEGTGKDPGSR